MISNDKQMKKFGMYEVFSRIYLLVRTSVSGVVERNNSSDSGCHSDKDDGVTTSQAAMGALKLLTSKLMVLQISTIVSRWLGF